MTIAAVYLSPEGVVLGADSTSTHVADNGAHYFNFCQKVFQVGEQSTLGILFWGLGGLDGVSYRTLVAKLADDLKANPPTSVDDAAKRWSALFWGEYSTFQLINTFKVLAGLSPHDPSDPTKANSRTKAQETEHENLKLNLFVGFYIAGYVEADRIPKAMKLVFEPGATQAPAHVALPLHTIEWMGQPKPFARLVFGADEQFLQEIQNSGKWTGTMSDLVALRSKHIMTPGVLPIRDAVDYVHSCIHSTIKAMKFSNLAQTCGGPIELAVITTDRSFRWVRHKPWDSAVADGDL